MTRKFDFQTVYQREGTRCVKYDMRNIIFGNSTVLPMWVADMDFPSPPFVIDALRRRLDHPILGYTFRDSDFASVLKSWLFRHHNLSIENDWVQFVSGVVPGLVYSILTYSNPGDKIIIQPPVYTPFFESVKDHDRVILENPLVKDDSGYYTMNFDDLEQKAKEAKMIIISNPHNPVGRSWNHEELFRLGEIALKNNLVVIADEIHSDLVLSGAKHVPFISVDERFKEIAVTFYAPSKTFNLAGMSTSAVVIPGEKLRKSYELTLQKFHAWLGNMMGLETYLSAYTDGDEWLNELISVLDENRNIILEFVSKYKDVLSISGPEATYMAWIDFSKLGFTDDELKDWLINKVGLGLNHGLGFGTGGDGYQRLNFACPKVILEHALSLLSAELDKLK
ncbi:MAG: PatB family C-S lyase [Sphingobacteriia bacterium]|nr:PatB family C-S lyase [Sphingobacteriia bacterium]